MTVMKVSYETEATHDNRDSIDKAGLSWNDSNTEITVLESVTSTNALKVFVEIEGDYYLDVKKQHRDLVEHFEEYGVTLQKKAYPTIIQKY